MLSGKTLRYKNSTIGYLRIDGGKQLAFCFPGFGEPSESFSIFNGYLKNYTLIALDLPFQGTTDWQEGLDIAPEQFWEILQLIKTQENFFDKDPIALIGYSLGGRLALTMLENYSDKISFTHLIASDGLKINFWYRMVSQTHLGNKIFKFTIHHPGWFINSVSLMKRMRLINKTSEKLVSNYLHNAVVRKQVYDVWTAFRYFKPNLKKIKLIINKQEKPVKIVMGRFDKVIPPRLGQKFQYGIEEYSTLTIIESGHQILQPKHAPGISKVLEL